MPLAVRVQATATLRHTARKGAVSLVELTAGQSAHATGSKWVSAAAQAHALLSARASLRHAGRTNARIAGRSSYRAGCAKAFQAHAQSASSAVVRASSAKGLVCAVRSAVGLVTHATSTKRGNARPAASGTPAIRLDTAKRTTVALWTTSDSAATSAHRHAGNGGWGLTAGQSVVLAFIARRDVRIHAEAWVLVPVDYCVAPVDEAEAVATITAPDTTIPAYDVAAIDVMPDDSEATVYV